jgi:hypothetical protein
MFNVCKTLQEKHAIYIFPIFNQENQRPYADFKTVEKVEKFDPKRNGQKR